MKIESLLFLILFSLCNIASSNDDFSWVDGPGGIELFQRALEKIDADGVHVKMRIRFDPGSYTIAENSKHILQAFGEKMENIENKLNGKFMILVTGHTDNIGDAENNMELSAKRAIAVSNYLIDYYDFDIEDFYIKYYGENSPIADNNSDEGQRNNRRVEFMILNEKIVTVKFDDNDATSTDSSFRPSGLLLSLMSRGMIVPHRMILEGNIGRDVKRNWDGALPLSTFKKFD